MKDISKSISKVLAVVLPLITILAVITPIVMVDSLFFPFISGKTFYFRILVEIMALLYILYICVDKSVRPRLSPIAIGVSVFTLVLAIATIFAEDPLKSFWSNYERMEGFVLFIHLAAYFFIAGSVLKLKQGWWKWFFVSSLVMSVIVGTHALVSFYSAENIVGYRISGNLGNSSYLGVYALIHVFIALFLIIQKVAKKSSEVLVKDGSWVMVSLYSLIAIFNVIILFNTGTRGSFVGLVGGIFIASLLIAIFEKRNKVLRRIGISLILLSVLFVAMLGFGRNTAFVKNSDMLTRFSELITLDVKGVLDNQGKARSLLWNIAWDGVKERPVAGWGLDNFHYVFAKHYDPGMAQQEQWFDRSHNVFMDWLTQAGFLGLFSYLSLFVLGLYIVWRRKIFGDHVQNKHDHGHHTHTPSAGMSISEKAVITGAFTAYLGHNLFVFDNLSSYVLFFSVLAFLHQLSIHKKIESIEEKKDQYAEMNLSLLMIVSLVAVIGFVYVLYAWNIKPLMANTAIISSLRPQIMDSKTGRVVTVPPKFKFEALQKSIAYGTMTNSEQLEQLADRGAEIMNSTESNDYKVAAHAYIVDKYENALKRTPNDPRPYFFYAIYLTRVNMISEAERVADKMILLSPNKPSFLNFVSMVKLQLNKSDEFLILSEKSYKLNPLDADAITFYRIGLITTGKYSEAESTATSTSDRTKYLSNWSVVSSYLDMKQGARIIDLINKQIALDPTILDLRSVLANVYVKLGNINVAVKILEDVKKIAPQYAAEIDQGIAQIRAEAKAK